MFFIPPIRRISLKLYSLYVKIKKIMKNIIFQRKGVVLIMKFKKVVSGLVCLAVLFSGSIDVFAYSSVNNNDSSKVYNDKVSDSFVEYVKVDGNNVKYDHHTDKNGNKIIEVFDGERHDVVKYDDSNNLLYLNGEKVTSVTETTETPSDNPILKKINKSVASNSWSLIKTEKTRWLVKNFTKASLAAAIAVFAAAPVTAVLVVVAGAYYTSAWMSSVKKSYYCSRYNGTWKTGIKYVSDVYADRNWSDRLKTFTKETSR